MNSIKILDCTLRDGGRIIECAFPDTSIVGIGKQLARAEIDIIELGFLRDRITYQGNSTFFGHIRDTAKYISDICALSKRKPEFVVFIDHGLYDVAKLPPREASLPDGIRFGFTRKDFQSNKDGVLLAMEHIKSLGYDLYVQDVNTNGYEEDELRDLLLVINSVTPTSVGIVDTYGAMYPDDFDKIANIVDGCLHKEIAIDFHSHNNMQMSFALTQKFVKKFESNRNIIIDSTLNGIGKCAGNLCTELIIDFMKRKRNKNYKIEYILDAIDAYLYQIKKTINWGYDIPAFMAGIYEAHPNNIIYLTEKYRINSNDIKYIISKIDNEVRHRYDYGNIDSIYHDYFSVEIDDRKSLSQLSKSFQSKTILILAPGNSLNVNKSEIEQFVHENNPIVIAINFAPTDYHYDYLFFANTILWQRLCDSIDKNCCIVTSNIRTDIDDAGYRVNYASLLTGKDRYCDNSAVMLLNLVLKFQPKMIALAGLDGHCEGHSNYVDESFYDDRLEKNFSEVNRAMSVVLSQTLKQVSHQTKILFLTPTQYTIE